MQVIITGATGFVGKAVLESCIEDKRIEKVFVLSRREVEEDLSNSSKVEVIIHKDFSTYLPTLTDRLKGAYACLWCIGGKAQDFPDIETARRVSVDYTISAASAFAKAMIPRNDDKFRFVFCSGRGAEQDDSKSLWLFPATRKIKGAVEAALFNIAGENAATFDTLIVRPGGIIPDDSRTIYNAVSYVIASVMVSDLAKVMIDLCIEGSDQKILENEDIVRRGQLT